MISRDLARSRAISRDLARSMRSMRPLSHGRCRSRGQPMESSWNLLRLTAGRLTREGARVAREIQTTVTTRRRSAARARKSTSAPSVVTSCTRRRGASLSSMATALRALGAARASRSSSRTARRARRPWIAYLCSMFTAVADGGLQCMRPVARAPGDVQATPAARWRHRLSDTGDQDRTCRLPHDIASSDCSASALRSNGRVAYDYIIYI